MTFVLSSPHNVLDAQTAFVSMSLINIMGLPLAILPAALMFAVQVSDTDARELSQNNCLQSFYPSALLCSSLDNCMINWPETNPLQQALTVLIWGPCLAQINCGKVGLLNKT